MPFPTLKVKINSSEYPLDFYYQSVFSKAHRENPDYNWDLLSAVFSMTLKGGDIKQPFVPSFSGGGRRSMIPLDLTDDDMNILLDTLALTNDAEYSARIRDLHWLQKRDASSAKQAVSFYLTSAKAIGIGKFVNCAIDRLERALRLSRQLNDVALAENAMCSIKSFVDEKISHQSNSGLSHLFSILAEFKSGKNAQYAAGASGLIPTFGTLCFSPL